MDEKNNTIDNFLKTIEFPGEDRVAIDEYLKEHDFTDSVMSRIQELHISEMKSLFWLLFILLNVVLLLFVGGNHYLLFDFLGLHKNLSNFFFLFLGLTLMGGLIGFVLTFDPEKIKKVFHIT